MMIWSWLGALLIGVMLGLLGSGGSILTVPVLIYLVGEPEKLAIAESLGIVMLISLIGAIPFALKRLVDWRSVLYFGAPAMVGSYGGAYVSQFVPGPVQLSLFGVVMLAAAVMMFRNSRLRDSGAKERQAVWKIAIEGMLVGVLTGLVGVGGGFLIVPALVLLGGLPMHLAVGTSLMIIALKSLTGFYKYIDVMHAAGYEMNWELILLFGAIGVVGSLAGKKIGEWVPQPQLKRVFACFLVVMGAFVLWQSTGSMINRDANALALHEEVLPGEPNHETNMNSFLSRFRRSGEPSGAARKERLNPDEFLEMRTGDAVIIDVRTKREYDRGHLAGAEAIDLQAPDFRDRVDGLDRSKTYFLYCRTGNRSGTATRLMRGMGFKDVYNIGGFDELVSAGAEPAH